MIIRAESLRRDSVFCVYCGWRISWEEIEWTNAKLLGKCISLINTCDTNVNIEAKRISKTKIRSTNAIREQKRISHR